MSHTVSPLEIVVTVARNGVIGREGRPPWPHLPDDMKRFRWLVVGRPVVMGSSTWGSLPPVARVRLRGDAHVLTRNHAYRQHNPMVLLHPDLDSAMDLIAGMGYGGCPAYVIGGAGLYREVRQRADCRRMHVTAIHADYPGDATFDPVETEVWRETARTHHPADDQHPVAFDFVTYERREAAGNPPPAGSAAAVS